MKGKKSTSKLTLPQIDDLLKTLETRFEKNRNRHPAIEWSQVRDRLDANADRLWSLHEMERTGGAPDVIGRDPQSGEYLFVDCSPESPAGRRSLCYDREALESRKEHPPKDNALDTAARMGVQILTESQYRELQGLGQFDLKTSSWIETPAGIRALGGALFCDRRYDHVFTYHNGAQSYYAARGFRSLARV